MKRTTILMLMLAQLAIGQRPIKLVPAKDSEAPILHDWSPAGDGALLGCRVLEKDVPALVIRVDCSAAMPWASKDKTIRRFCVVKQGERFIAAFVEPKSRLLRRCVVTKTQ